MEIHLVPACFSQFLVFSAPFSLKTKEETEAVTSSSPICNIGPKEVLLRRDSNRFSATTLASVLQLMPNPLHGAVEWVRDHKLREAGWHKVDFHLKRASASVSALIFREKGAEKREEKQERELGLFHGFRLFTTSVLSSWVYAYVHILSLCLIMAETDRKGGALCKTLPKWLRMVAVTTVA